jgi:hypothetical protein
MQKTWLPGRLSVANGMPSRPKNEPFWLALTKTYAAGTMKKPHNKALVPEWRNWQTR